VRSIDAANKKVDTDAGIFEADILVIALGADLDPAATPGLVECGNEFYTLEGAFGLREVLADFPGGRVVVAVTSTPFKCPPAPSETALLVHEHLVNLGVRERSEVTLVMPLPVPIPPSPQASEALLTAFAERGITWMPGTLVRGLDPARRVALLGDDTELPYDLFLGVPKHRVPEIVETSGLCVDGWIPVDPQTLATSVPDVYAVGDVTSVGTPKAGVFAEGQAGVVADAIIARHRAAGAAATYDGRGVCYLEFGDGEAGRVEVTFLAGAAPVGTLDGPSLEIAADKSEFGASRIRRWFAREWSTT
jgi:sulfide:quinone oxidoreductase